MHTVSLPGLSAPLVLHPRLTVIAGLDAERRAALAEEVAAAVEALAGADTGLVEEIERAHAEVEAAEAALRTVVGRRRSRQRLAAARALERALLEGAGYQSYIEARLASIAPADRAPVPMVVDDAVVTVAPDELAGVLDHLAASHVQVIWATADPVVVATAVALGDDRAAVVVVGPSAVLGRV